MEKDKSQSRLAPIDEDRRLIEEIIPIKEIGISGAMEKRNRFANISSLHNWWARKPITVSRSLIFLSLINKHNNGDNVKKLIYDSYKWETNSNKAILNKLKDAIKKSRNEIPKVLDCFAGGGSIPLEALRLGCDTYALDFNPVAYIILLCTLYYPEKYSKTEQFKRNKLILDFKKYADIMQRELKEESKDFYPKDKGEPIAYVWARTVKCSNPQCGVDVPLISNAWLAKKVKKEFAVKFVPSKGKIGLKLESENFDFNPDEGTIKRGTCICPLCKQTTGGSYIKKYAKEKGFGNMLLSVITTKNSKSKIYNLPDESELQAYEKCKTLLRKYEKVNLGLFPAIPNEKLPTNTQYSGPVVYGLELWKQIFNDRQLLINIMMAEKIHSIHKLIFKESRDKEYADAISTLLALVVDRIIDHNSSLCLLYSIGGRGVVHTFGRGALPMSWDYAETYPFNPVGANWDTAVQKVVEIIDSINTIQKSGNVFLGSAMKMDFKDTFFDLVITDPPYHDYIPYSDLSDFFYVWLKRSIGFIYPKAFSTLLTPKKDEIFERKKSDQFGDKRPFKEQLHISFLEINRILKEKGLFVIIFAHKSTSAWEDLIDSLLKSNFIITASWPINTELPSRLRAQNSAALASSITLVCRKRAIEDEGYFNEIKEDLKNKIQRKLDEFWKQGIQGADFFISAIGPAVEVFGKYKKVKKLSGEEVTVSELLDEVRKIVTDYSLHQILHDGKLGNIDDLTRFYVLWRWAYGDADVPFDDARKLAQALGTEPDELLSKKGLLKKKGDKVNMFEPWERKDEHLGEPKHGLPASMIDVIHRACMLWEKNNKKALEDFIEASGYAREEALWNVAQAISEILPDGNKEKQLLQGLLNTKTSIKTDKFKSQTMLNSYKGE